MFSRRSIDIPCSYCSAKNRAIVGRTAVIAVDRTSGTRVDRSVTAVIYFLICAFCKSDVVLYEETL